MREVFAEFVCPLRPQLPSQAAGATRPSLLPFPILPASAPQAHAAGRRELGFGVWAGKSRKRKTPSSCAEEDGAEGLRGGWG